MSIVTDNKKTKIANARVAIRDSMKNQDTKDNSTKTPINEEPPLPKLDTIAKRILALKDDVPSEEDTKMLSPTDKTNNLELWCQSVYMLKQRFDMHIHFIAPVEYKWHSERSTTSTQNLDNLCDHMKSALEILGEATSSCTGVFMPNLLHVADQEIKREEIVPGIARKDSDDLQDLEQQNDEDGTSSKTAESTAAVTDSSIHSSRSMICGPPNMKRRIIKSWIRRKEPEDPRLVKLHRELVCDTALYRRELILLALSKAGEAFADYSKAAANDNHSRDSRSTMMM